MAAYPDFRALDPRKLDYSALVKDLSGRKEFNVFEPANDSNADPRQAPDLWGSHAAITGLQPTGPQQFIRNIITNFLKCLDYLQKFRIMGWR